MVDDARWMRRAIEHARRGLGRTTPNPVVGACVVTDEGVVVGDGAHERAGGPHAEVHALEGARTSARGATLYCTLEPCAHTGRTGPCTERIAAAGIRRVVAAMEDPFPLVRGRGFAVLRSYGITVELGVERDAAAKLNQPFLTTVIDRRPFVILKAATSLDGRVTAGPGVRTVLTSMAALRHAHGVRAEVDGVVVGSDTVLVDDPFLTAREVYRERPLTRVVFDRRLRVSAHAHVFSTLEAGPVIMMTSREALAQQPARVDALERAGATVVAMEGDGLAQAFGQLATLGLQSVVLEGGPTLQAAAWEAGLIDQVHLYLAPVVLGSAGLPLLEGRSFSVTSLLDASVDQLGPDVLVQGYVHRPH